MKTCQVHPLSITIGAIAAALLLFACSSGGGGGGRSVPSPGPYQSPAASSLVTFYSDTPIGNGTYDFGTVDETVITDIHWVDSYAGRLLVNGATVFGWGGGHYDGPSPRFTLAHGIRIPAGASLAVETDGGSFISLAGYRP
jgi:hypothetical protein